MSLCKLKSITHTENWCVSFMIQSNLKLYAKYTGAASNLGESVD